jgi:hypothetical protein
MPTSIWCEASDTVLRARSFFCIASQAGQDRARNLDQTATGIKIKPRRIMPYQATGLSSRKGVWIMKSRLAVSILFILIASTFTSDAISDFKKLGSWAGEIYRNCATDVFTRNSATATQSHDMSVISSNGRSFAFNSAEVTKLVTWFEAHVHTAVFKVVGSNHHCAACDFMRKASRQIREAAGLIRIQYAAD